jgi:hypothetical protein
MLKMNFTVRMKLRLKGRITCINSRSMSPTATQRLIERHIGSAAHHWESRNESLAEGLRVPSLSAKWPPIGGRFFFTRRQVPGRELRTLLQCEQTRRRPLVQAPQAVYRWE